MKVECSSRVLIKFYLLKWYCFPPSKRKSRMLLIVDDVGNLSPYWLNGYGRRKFRNQTRERLSRSTTNWNLFSSVQDFLSFFPLLPDAFPVFCLDLCQVPIYVCVWRDFKQQSSHSTFHLYSQFLPEPSSTAHTAPINKGNASNAYLWTEAITSYMMGHLNLLSSARPKFASFLYFV